MFDNDNDRFETIREILNFPKQKSFFCQKRQPQLVFHATLLDIQTA